MMRTRGFTLLEILVALGVLGVVLGLSLPAVSSRLERGSFDANAERLIGVLRQARDEARRSGQPVEVRVRTLATGRGLVEWAAVQDPAAPGDVDRPDSADERWSVLMEFPRGAVLSDQDPAGVIGDEPGPAELLGDEGAGERTRRVCVFTPAGEAIVAGPAWFVDAEAGRAGEAERWVRIEISPWTARITSERGTRAGAMEMIDDSFDDGEALIAPDASGFERGVAP